MKELSMAAANRLRSGQTLFWIETHVNLEFKLVVETKVTLLLGKKRILPGYNFLELITPPHASFTRKLAGGFVDWFTIPAESGRAVGDIWFFANRRSMLEAARKLTDGTYPEYGIQAIVEARRIALENERREQANRDWLENAPKDENGRAMAVRAFGEAEIWPRGIVNYTDFSAPRFHNTLPLHLVADIPELQGKDGGAAVGALLTGDLSEESRKLIGERTNVDWSFKYEPTNKGQ